MAKMTDAVKNACFMEPNKRWPNGQKLSDGDRQRRVAARESTKNPEPPNTVRVAVRSGAMVRRPEVIECWSRKWQTRAMQYHKDKVDEMVLALLFLTLHDDDRAWKGHDWDAMSRLHDKGMISDPVGKAKSVSLTEAGRKRAEELFRKHFCS